MMPDLAIRAPRILIIRLSALGDVVMASGLIPSLRSLHPTAHLAWLCEPAAAPLLAHNPNLDEVIVWPKEQWKALAKARQWPSLLKEIRAFRQSLKAQQFDLVLDTQGLFKSGIWAWLTKAPRRISLGGREGSQCMATEVLSAPPESDARMGKEYRQLARHLGARDDAFVPQIIPGPAAQARALQTLADAGVLVGTQANFAVVCPFTTRPQKHWFAEHWQTVFEGLAAQSIHIVMLGGPADQAAAADLCRNGKSKGKGVINLVGKLKIHESAAVIAQCKVLIGVDTGLTHMGSAFKRPTVAIFGSTCPYLDAGSSLTRVIYDALPCSPCHRHPSCHQRFDCMRQIDADRVLRVASDLMKQHPA